MEWVVNTSLPAALSTGKNASIWVASRASPHHLGKRKGSYFCRDSNSESSYRNLVNTPTKLSWLLRTFKTKQSSNSLKYCKISTVISSDKKSVAQTKISLKNGKQYECWERKYMMFSEKLPMKKSGQPSGWWEDDINIDLRQILLQWIRTGDWIKLAHDLRPLYKWHLTSGILKAGNRLTYSVVNGCSRKILLDVFS